MEFDGEELSHLTDFTNYISPARMPLQVEKLAQEQQDLNLLAPLPTGWQLVTLEDFSKLFN